MNKKLLSVLLALVLALSLCLVTAVPVAANGGTPTIDIDGVIAIGEWEGATSFTIGSYTGYVTNDEQNMYVAYDYAIKTVGEWANIITYRAGLTPEKTYISWVFVGETGLEPQRWKVEDTHTVTEDGKRGEEIVPDGLFTPFELGTDPDNPVFVDKVDVAGAKKTNLVYAVNSATEMAIPLKELGLTPELMFPSGGDSIKIMPGINTLPNTIFVYPDSEIEEDDPTTMWSWDPNNYADYTLWVPLYNLEITIAGQGQVTYIDPDTGLVEKPGDGTTWTMSYKAGTWSDVFTAQTWDQYPNWEFVHWTVHTSTDDIISPEPTGAIPIFEDLSVTATFAPNTVVVTTAETKQITAINVEPTNIDFGSLKPGEAVSGDDISVTNIGTVKVDVIAALAEAGTVFKYLKLDGVSPVSNWPGIQDLAGGDTAAPVKTLLDVPRDYSAMGVETNTLIFTVRTN